MQSSGNRGRNRARNPGDSSRSQSASSVSPVSDQNGNEQNVTLHGESKENSSGNNGDQQQEAVRITRSSANRVAPTGNSPSAAPVNSSNSNRNNLVDRLRNSSNLGPRAVVAQPQSQAPHKGRELPEIQPHGIYPELETPHNPKIFGEFKIGIESYFMSINALDFIERPLDEIIDEKIVQYRNYTTDEIIGWAHDASRQVAGILRISTRKWLSLIRESLKCILQTECTSVDLFKESDLSVYERAPYYLWQATLRQFDKKSMHNTSRIITELINLRTKLDENPGGLYKRVAQLRDRLMQSEESFADFRNRLVQVCILGCLPEEFQSFKQQYYGQKKFNLDEFFTAYDSVWQGVKGKKKPSAEKPDGQASMYTKRDSQSEQKDGDEADDEDESKPQVHTNNPFHGKKGKRNRGKGKGSKQGEKPVGKWAFVCRPVVDSESSMNGDSSDDGQELIPSTSSMVEPLLEGESEVLIWHYDNDDVQLVSPREPQSSAMFSEIAFIPENHVVPPAKFIEILGGEPPVEAKSVVVCDTQLNAPGFNNMVEVCESVSAGSAANGLLSSVHPFDSCTQIKGTGVKPLEEIGTNMGQDLDTRRSPEESAYVSRLLQPSSLCAFIAQRGSTDDESESESESSGRDSENDEFYDSDDELAHSLASFTSPYSKEYEWILDSGTWGHVCCNKNLLKNVRSLKSSFRIYGVQGKTKISEYGQFIVNDNVSLNIVYYVPGGTANLISLGRLLDTPNIVVDFTPKKAVVKHVPSSGPRTTIMVFYRKPGGMWVMSNYKKTPQHEQADRDISIGAVVKRNQSSSIQSSAQSSSVSNKPRNEIPKKQVQVAAGNTAGGRNPRSPDQQ